MLTKATQSTKATKIPNLAYLNMSGGVYFAKTRLMFYPVKTAFVRMHHLHLRSHMAQSAKNAKRHRQTSAKFFRRALECTLASFMAATEQARLVYAKGLFDAVEQVKGFGGLESLFLTAMTTAAHAKDSALFDRGAKLWQQFGAPMNIGGASKAALVVDAATKKVAYLGAKGLASLAPGGANAQILAPGHINDVYASVASTVSALDTGIAQDGDGICVSAFAAVGAIIGGVLGRKGGKTGEIVAGAIGEQVGKTVGGAVCGAFDSQDTTGGYSGHGGASADSGTGTDDTSSSSSSSQDTGQTCNPDDPSDGNTSGGDDNSGNDNSGDDNSGDDNSGNSKDDDPDDIMPVPPEVGYQLFSDAYAMGPGVASHMSRLAGGGVLLTGMPTLDANGRLASAGIVASVADVAQYVSTVANNANHVLVDPAKVGAREAP